MEMISINFKLKFNYLVVEMMITKVLTIKNTYIHNMHIARQMSEFCDEI